MGGNESYDIEQYRNNAAQQFPKIIGVGRNYQPNFVHNEHSTPVIFMKPWSTVTYDPTKVALSSLDFHRIDFEIELGVYISKGGNNIPKQEVMNHIGGYFIGIDFSDYECSKQSMQKGLPEGLAKGQDNFTPISPIFTKDINPYQLQLQLKINGVTKQKDITNKMNFKIDQVISYCSKFIRFIEGDLILTGTPDGPGPVKSGDRLQAYGRIAGQTMAKLQFQISN